MPTKPADRTEAPAEQTASKGEVAIFSPPRLPYHPKVEETFRIDRGTWKVLVEAIFPAAKSVDAIVMALSYCKSRNLDIMKRPVHIVPMWDSARGDYVETVWPGISELRTTASRTSGYAGCDEAVFGPSVRMEFKGRVKARGEWTEKKTELEFPEWCRVTVYRIVAGMKCKFVGPKVKWLETYATQGASELPNKMWEERAEGQLEKCAEAAALRRAFPEEIGNELTAEEMTGRSVHDITGEIPAITNQAPAADDRDPAPPRSTAPDPDPGQDHAAGEVQDATPPRRAAAQPKEPKAGPIMSGPQPRAAANPKTKEVTPFKIPGTGETVETWSEKYIDNIKTSPDMATAYKWIDVNTDPLARLAKLNAPIALKVRQATERLMEQLRDAQAKAQAKTAAKAKPAAAPPSEMDDGPADGEMEDSLGGEAPANYGKPADDNPETILKWIDATLATVSDPENLEEIWVQHCEPKILDMFPPDKSEAQAIYDRHEKRLGMD